MFHSSRLANVLNVLDGLAIPSLPYLSQEFDFSIIDHHHHHHRDLEKVILASRNGILDIKSRGK
jgi:hypothetical protein